MGKKNWLLLHYQKPLLNSMSNSSTTCLEVGPMLYRIILKMDLLSKFNLPICTLCLQAHPKVTKMRRNGFLKGVRLSYPILLLPSPR